jgi:hypothetical protein
MTDRIAQIAARLKAATPGPWYTKHVEDMPFDMGVDCGAYCQGGTAYIELPHGTGCRRATYADLQLMTNCPTDIAFLLALIDAQEKVVSAARKVSAVYPDDSNGLHTEMTRALKALDDLGALK